MIRILISLLLILCCLPSFATLSEPDRAIITLRNILTNPGFENGKTGWTNTGGTFTTTSTAANVALGALAGSWATGGSSNDFTSPLVLIPPGLYGVNGVATCRVKGATASHVFEVDDGTNILSQTTVPLSSNYSRVSVNFTFPTSGSIELGFTSASSQTIFVDDCYIGDSTGFTIFIQPIAADWNTDLSVTYTSLGTSPTGNSFLYKRVGDTMFASATVTTTTCSAAPGYITLPAGLTIDTSKIPAGAANTIPLGDGIILTAATNAINAVAGTTFVLYYDGTHTDRLNFAFRVSSGTYVADNITTFIGNTTPINVAFKIPITSWASTGVSYSPDQTANSWSGYHDTDCSWAGSGHASFSDYTVADTSCTFTTRTNVNFGTVTSLNDGTTNHNLPGIVFTPSVAGSYFVCANLGGTSSANAAFAFQLTDGTTPVGTSAGSFDLSAMPGNPFNMPTCGIYRATSTSPVSLKVQHQESTGSTTINRGTSPSIEWSIFQINQALPNPLIIGSVSTSSSLATTRMDSARLTCGNSGSTVIANTGTGSSWISSVSNGGGAGICTVNFSAGEFAQEPACTCNRVVSGVRSNAECQPQQATSSSIVINTEDGATGTNGDVYLQCIGLH